MLSDQELLRYSRQVLLAQIDIDGQLRLKPVSYTHLTLPTSDLV